MADQMKFVDLHNIAEYLLDPPAAHDEFKSMIAGLNNCRITHALRVNLVICKESMTDFWKNTSIDRQGVLVSTVKGISVTITEQTIREVLEFGDKPEFPIEYPVERVHEVLARMCYEGTIFTKF